MCSDTGFLVSANLTKKQGLLPFFLAPRDAPSQEEHDIAGIRKNVDVQTWKKKLHNSTTQILGTLLQILFQKKD